MVGALIVIIKVIAIPRAFFGLAGHLKTSSDMKASTTPTQSVFIAAAMIYLSYVAVQPYGQSVHVAEDALAAPVALILTGAFLMVSRNKALMQMLGLLVLEMEFFWPR